MVKGKGTIGVVLACVLGLTVNFQSPAFGIVGVPVSVQYGAGTTTKEVSLADYVRSLYPSNTYDEVDEEAIRIIEHIENNEAVFTDCMGQRTYALIHDSDNAATFHRFFNDWSFADFGGAVWNRNFDVIDIYGNTGNIGLSANIGDMSVFKMEYINSATIAKQIAGYLKRETDWDTAQAVYEYVSTHATYGYGCDKDGVVGFYNGEPIDCSGFAAVTVQLCRFNGIPAHVVVGTDATGEPHAWSKVMLCGNWYYIDSCQQRGLSEELYMGYAITPRTE